MKKILNTITSKYNSTKKLIYKYWVHINVYVVFIMVLAGIVQIYYANTIFELVKAVTFFSLSAFFWALLNIFRK